MQHAKVTVEEAEEMGRVWSGFVGFTQAMQAAGDWLLAQRGGSMYSRSDMERALGPVTDDERARYSFSALMKGVIWSEVSALLAARLAALGQPAQEPSLAEQAMAVYCEFAPAIAPKPGTPSYKATLYGFERVVEMVKARGAE